MVRLKPSSPLRILYFAPKECWPPDTGAKLRNYHLARALAHGARVTFLGFCEDGLPSAALAADSAGLPPALHALCERVITVPRDRGYTPGKIARGATSRTPISVLNYTTRRMTSALTRLLQDQEFDVVQVESLLLSAYLPVLRSAPSRPLIACDWHNIDSEVFRRYSDHAPSLAHKLYARLTAGRVRGLERRSMRAFDAHLVVSERDRAHLKRLDPQARVFVVDNGVDAGYFSGEAMERAYGSWLAARRLSPEPPNRVIFVGSMDYHANADAVVRFARETWPALREQAPGLCFTIVGRNPGPQVRALASLPGVEVTGTVADVRPYYRSAVAAVVPLRVGGGSRLKILEAMAAGVAVISTRLGAEGLEVKDRRDVLLAETGDQFREALLDLCRNEGERARVASAARALAQSRYDWSAIGDSLHRVYLDLTDRAAGFANRKSNAMAAVEVSA